MPISQEGRSRIMSAIRKRNTKPELAVRHFLHRQGLRYVLHGSRLAGHPDLVFPSLRSVVFVHGCFWHRCPHCVAGKKQARSNTPYWASKFERNTARDARVTAQLGAEGWKVHIVWECETKDQRILERLAAKLRSARKSSYARVSLSQSATAAGKASTVTSRS
jgi:DNA mismatch endonuclease (patch repair protein)